MGDAFQVLAERGLSRHSMLQEIKEIHDEAAGRAIWNGEILRPRSYFWTDEDGGLHYKFRAVVVEIVAPWRQPC
jgi:hypothetical protein